MLGFWSKFTSGVFIILLVCGCAQLQKLDFGRMFQSLNKSSKVATTEKVRLEVESLLDQSKSTDALALMQESGIPATDFSHEYPRTINMLTTHADNLFFAGDIVTSGNLYRSAFNSYPDETALRKRIHTDKATLQLNIDRCADKLLETGLAAYRDGKLQNAIDVWTQIRQFHPTYKASQQAIQTTRTQLKNLESIKGPS